MAEGYSLDTDKEAYESAFGNAFSSGVFDDSQDTDYLTLFRNIHDEKIDVKGGRKYASDGTSWIDIGGAE